MLRTWLAPAVAALALGLASPALPRAFTVDDLLRQESLGQRVIDPTGRWLVFERRDPYESAGRFDRDGAMGAALSRLQVVDLARAAPARPLVPGDAGAGVSIVSFSPSGGRLAVARLRDDSWSLGVVTLATGAVRWLSVTPEDPPFGRTLEWLDEDTLLVIERPDGVPPWYLRNGSASAAGLPPLWAASARGDAGGTVIGSGAYRDLRAHRPPNRLLRIDVASAQIRELLRGDFFDLEVSPDGRRVALLAFDGDRQPRADGPAQGSAGTSTRTATLAILDLMDGRLRRPLAGADVLPTLMAWSPDSTALLAFARTPGAPWTEGRFQRVRTDPDQTTPLGEDLEPWLGLRPELLRAGWMGAAPIAYARPRGRQDRAFEWRRLDGGQALTAGLPAGTRDLLAVDSRSLSVQVGGTAWRVDARGQAHRLALQDVARAAEATGAHAPRLAAELPAGAWVECGPAVARVRIWLTARGPAAASPVQAVRELLAAAPASGAALTRNTDVRGVETLSVLRPGRPPLAVARLNTGLLDTDAPDIRPVRHPGPEGQPLTSWLYLPPRPPGARAPPLIVRPYSGASYPAPPREFFGEKGFMTDLRMLVGHGYAVLVPSLPLPRDAEDPMAGLADRILAAVDAAAADRALADTFDPDRIALWGHSYGGYTVMAAIGQTDRFRAAVSIAGFSDMISKWAALPAVHRVATDEDLRVNWSTGSVEQGQGGMQVPPWADPGRYLRNSPLMAADRVRTPLLLAHGDQDIIPLPQSEAMFAALYRQNKDAILLTYFGEGHGLRSPGNVRDFYARAFRFLDERLAPVHPSQRCAPGASGTRPCQ